MEVDSVVVSSISLWDSMQSWLTPTFLFLLLNLMIATIAFTSSSSLSTNSTNTNTSVSDPKSPPSSSLLHRLRSLSLSPSPYKSLPDTPPNKCLNTHGISDGILRDEITTDTFSQSVGVVEVERSLDEVFSEVALPRIKKSSSMKLSRSAHSHDADVAEVEARRPATVRERRGKKAVEGDEEVDAKADDFINRFKNQLKLQRMDSIVRYKKEMIGSAK